MINTTQTQKQYQYDDDQQFETIQQKQPTDTIISLKNQKAQQQTKHQENQQHQQQVDYTKLLKQLHIELSSKISQTNNIRKDIENKKKQLKDIAKQVDKQMNRSLLKYKNHQAINIKDIFHPRQLKNNVLKQLKEQLNKLRANIKKQQQINKRQEYILHDPVNEINMQRSIDFLTKYRQKDVAIQEIRKEKQMLNIEIDRIKGQFNVEIYDNMNDETEKYRQQLQQMQQKVKQQKIKVYQLDKVDCIATQKLHYIKEMTQSLCSKKKNQQPQITNQQRLQIYQGIKNMSCQIKYTMDEKFRTQSQRSSLVKVLNVQVKTIQKKNWELIQALRQIDSYLLKFYSARLRDPRKSVKKREKQLTQHSALVTLRVTDHNNDKNFVDEEVFMQPIIIQKRKNIQLGLSTNDENHILLSDDFIGNKKILAQLSFIVDDNYIYGTQAVYLNDKRQLINGYNITSRIRPKDIRQIKLTIDTDNEEQITSIKAGFIGKEKRIKYLKIETNINQQLKWGTEEDIQNKQQKYLKKYQSIYMKGKLISMGENYCANNYCLGGIGFTIFYMSMK